MFKPYASIGTNLLFFEKGTPTQDIWFYEHRVPATQKAYSMTRPIRLEHLQGCVDWWGGTERTGRVETEVAWKVSAEEVKARGYNLDFKNPHTVAEDHGDPEELLMSLNEAEARAAALREQLKGILQEALLRDTLADARTTLERMKPLESFAAVDSAEYVRGIRNKSRILKSGEGA